MKRLLILTTVLMFIAVKLHAQACTPLGDQTTYGTNDTWIGYIYDNINFTSYAGYVNEGTPGNPGIDESFGGDYVNYATNGCTVFTETFSARYKLSKNFSAGNYQITVGGDDGYRLSLDGGATWVINNWFDQAYSFTTYVTTLSGITNMVLEFYENGGANRVTFSVQPVCVGTENQTIYGTGNIWNGYLYDGTNFNQFKGVVTEGIVSNPTFDESFGGNNVMYPTSSCSVQTETFSARYRLQKFFASGSYVFTVGGDDGYRLSLDGGSTWVINRWFDQSYNVTSYSTTLNGTYNMVLEYYENAGGNRVSFTVSGSALPVELTRFGAVRREKDILINWTTAREINTAYYRLERSSNGIDFSPIATINTGGQNGNSTQQLHYSHTDKSPLPGVNYYRLRITDIDSRFTYSSVAKASVSTDNGISIYPTVLSNDQMITLLSAQPITHASVELYDLSGRKIQATSLNTVVAANQPVSLPLTHQQLAKGTYIIICKDGTNILKKQLILLQ